jgi:O-antigen ligase
VGSVGKFTEGFTPLSNKILRVFGVTFCLYSVAVLTTTAGMEILGWLSALLVMIVLGVESRRNKELLKKVFLPVDWVLLGFVVVVILGALINTPDRIGKIHAVGSSRWALLFILLRVGLTWIWSDRVFKKMLYFLMALIGVISLYSIWQYFNGLDLLRLHRGPMIPFGYSESGRPFYRVGGMWGTPMTFAYSLVLSMSFPLAFFIVRAEKGKRAWLISSVMIASTFALMASLTRGAYLAAAGALIYLAINSIRRGTALIVGAFLIFYVATNWAFPEIKQRIHKITDTTSSSSTYRFDLWRANFEIVKEFPLLGVGYGVNEEVLQEFYPRIGKASGFNGHAHNTFLQIAAGTGALGFVLFFLFTIYFLRMNWQLRRTAQPGWQKGFIEACLAAQIALHIGGLTECNFKDLEVNHQFMLILMALSAFYLNHEISRFESFEKK